MSRIPAIALISMIGVCSCQEEHPTDTVLDQEPVITQSPPTPLLVSPSDNASGVALSPRLYWGKSHQATLYRGQVSLSNEFTEIRDSFTVSATQSSYGIAGLQDSTTYFWRVRAENSAGVSGWPPAWKFQTWDRPEGPALISPADQDTVSTSPLLVWGSRPGATGYDLELSTVSTFATVIFRNTNPLTVTARQFQDLQAGMMVYWRVRSRYAQGPSDWSETRAFSVTLVCAVPSITHEGQIYRTVAVGDRCWLKRNLDAGTRVNGWRESDNGLLEKSCLENDPANCAIYGGLYTWREAMQFSTAPGSRGICPEGWHLPTEAEYDDLIAAVDGSEERLTAPGQGHSDGPDINSSGWTALLWDRKPCTTDCFLGLDSVFSSTFWSSTLIESVAAATLFIDEYGSSTPGLFIDLNSALYSVRCVAD